MQKDNIKVKGHKGTWYIIDSGIMYGNTYYLLEHETYGEDIPAVAIRQDGSLVLDNIYNGIEELYQYLEENPLLH